MVAECEFGACGVLAVGRCRTCGHAMCTSHRAIGSQGLVVDQCLSCQHASRQQARADHVKVLERIASAQGRVKHAASRLAAAGFRPTELYATASLPRKFLFWRYSKKTPLRGWPVGEHQWRLPNSGPRSEGTYTAVRTTFVTGTGELALADGHVEDNLSTGLGPYGLQEQADAWERLANAMTRLEHEAMSG